MEQLVHSVYPGLGADLFQLALHALIVCGGLHVPDDAESYWEIRLLHVSEHELDAQVVGMRVVGEDIIHGDTVLPYCDNLERKAVEDYALVLVLAEYHLLPVPQDNGMVCTDGGVRQATVRPVIEYHAVGEHLHNGSPFVPRGCEHYLLVERDLDIQAAGKERPASPKHERTGNERLLDSPVRRGLGDRPELGGGAVLPLGEAVDLVVEQYQVDVHIAPYGMDEMVAADSKRVTVAARLPHAERGVGELDAGADGGSPAVNAVEPVGGHVIRQT